MSSGRSPGRGRMVAVSPCLMGLNRDLFLPSRVLGPPPRDVVGFWGSWFWRCGWEFCIEGSSGMSAVLGICPVERTGGHRHHGARGGKISKNGGGGGDFEEGAGGRV